MAHRTTRRNGLYTETGGGSAVANVQKSKGVSIVTKFKGLQDNKNDVVAVQDSLADVDNLYIDDNDLLSSRPPVKLFTPEHTLQGVSATSIRMWNIEGYIFRLLKNWSSENITYYLICDNKIPVTGEDIAGDKYIERNAAATLPVDQEVKVSFAPIKDKIFVWIGLNSTIYFYYFDVSTYRFINEREILETDIDAGHIYTPIINFIENGVYTKQESYNLLNPLAYRNRYKYGLTSNIDFSSLQPGWNRLYYANNNDEFIEQVNTRHNLSNPTQYPNDDFSSVIVYPRGNINSLTYYDIVEIVNSYGEKMPVILCWYKDDQILKYSVDGRNYAEINLPSDVTPIDTKPFILSKDGSMIVCFATDGIYIMNIFDTTASNYMEFEKHSYLENARSTGNVVITFDPSQHSMNNAVVIGYFYTENIYAYILLVDNEKWLCVSHMRATQRVDGVSLTTENFTVEDKICMCPRYLDYMTFNDDDYITPGPLVMYTHSSGIAIHKIAYKNNNDIDDILGFTYGVIDSYDVIDNSTTPPTTHSRQIFDVIDTGTYYRDYVDISMSETPNYYTDEDNNLQADIEIVAVYKASYSRIHFRKGRINRNNIYTQLKRVYKEYSSSSGRPSFAGMRISLTKASMILRWGTTYIQHYYKWDDLPNGTTGTGSTPIAAPSMPSSVPDYKLPVELDAILVPFSNTDDLWAIKDGRLWTTMLFSDTVIYIDNYMSYGASGPINGSVVMPTHFTALQEYYFSFDAVITIADDTLIGKKNVLAVTQTKYNKYGEFQLYLPSDYAQFCINEITNLCPISTQYVGVFLEDSIWYAGTEYLNDRVVYKELVKSKIPFGCKKGTDVFVTSDGQSIIFPTYRGVALLGPQDFVATTDPIIKYISDNIQNMYLRFYSETMQAIYQTGDVDDGINIVYGNTAKTISFGISFTTYKYWIFMYKKYCREVLLYDMRDSTWWTWTMPYPVIDMVSVNRLYVLLNTPSCVQLLPNLPDANKGSFEEYDYEHDTPVLYPGQSIGDLFVVADKEADLGYALKNFPHVDPSVDDFSYEDEIIPYTLNGEVKVVKDDSLDGSHVELDLPQSRIDWFLISQKLYLGALNNYKSITGINIVAKGLYEYGTKLTVRVFRNVEHPEDSIDMDIFVKDLRTFVQRLNLMHAIFFQYKLSNTDEDKQRQAHIASLCVKYETKEAVR